MKRESEHSCGRALLVLVATLGLLVVARSADAAPAISSDGLSPSWTTNAHDRTLTIYGSGFEPGAVVELVELVPGSENVPGQERPEEVRPAKSNGSVSSSGQMISGVVLPTAGAAPSSPTESRPDTDVSWFVRVRNPDGEQSYSREFRIDAAGPLALTENQQVVAAGTSAQITLRGQNFARRASFSTPRPTPPTYTGSDSITFSGAEFVDATTYRVTVTVPADYPIGYVAPITMTNTDGQAKSCNCVVVERVALPATPTIRKVTPTSAANNGTARPTVYGTKFVVNGTQAGSSGTATPTNRPARSPGIASRSRVRPSPIGRTAWRAPTRPTTPWSATWT